MSEEEAIQMFISKCNPRAQKLYEEIAFAVRGVFTYRIEGFGEASTLIMTYPHGPSEIFYARPCIKLGAFGDNAQHSFTALDDAVAGIVVVECGEWAAHFSLSTPSHVILEAIKPYCRYGGEIRYAPGYTSKHNANE